MENKANKQSWYKSPWLLGWLFLVATVIAVNAYMISQSINDFPGLVVDDFYERGQDYEENIHHKLENNQKWTPQFQLGDIHINKPAVITFAISDSEGKPAKVEKITLFAYRPSDARKDFSVAMKSSDNNQSFQADITFTSKGKWDLLSSVIIDGIEVNYAKKIFVKD
ncbi:MAG: FixH family protein [Pseudomonadota bacterium]